MMAHRVSESDPPIGPREGGTVIEVRRYLVDGSDIASFVLVAESATKCKILRARVGAMLCRDDVIYLVCNKRQSLRYQTVLTLSAGPGANFRSKGRVNFSH
jgi:hypothetical protein